MLDQLRFILAGAHVRRFHTKPTLVVETNGHHSHGVACLINLLYPDARKELLIAALYHDLAEQESGDLPAPMKREAGIRDAIKKWEFNLHKEAGVMVPALDEEENRRLTLADSLHGAIYCLEECERGNHRVMKPLFLKYLTYIKTLATLNHEKNLYEALNNSQFANRGV
jgi:5'-deoxynucleotidase YfbR-like HD superfamily hydrolase